MNSDETSIQAPAAPAVKPVRLIRQAARDEAEQSSREQAFLSGHPQGGPVSNADEKLIADKMRDGGMSRANAQRAIILQRGYAATHPKKS